MSGAPPEKGPPPDWVVLVSQFLEAAVHQTLHVRSIYPAALFVRTKLFGVSVQMSRHPELNHYVHRAVDGARRWLEAGELEALAVVIRSPRSGPLERVLFEFPRLPLPSEQEPMTEEGGATDRLRGSLASFLLKTSMLNTSLGAANFGDDVTFSIALRTRTAQGAQLDVREWEQVASDSAMHLREPTVVPLKHERADDVGVELQLSVERRR